MTIADRILELRKQKGISQETLASELGISRQAVSKWESQQSTPELDKVILMSDYFDVSTDYLLKGEETVEPVDTSMKQKGNTISLLAPFLSWIGYIVSCVLWFEYQNAFAVMTGFIVIGISIVLIYVAKMNKMIEEQKVRRFWIIAFPAISAFCYCVIYNILFFKLLAPYPLISSNYFVVLMVLIIILIVVNIAFEIRLLTK